MLNFDIIAIFWKPANSLGDCSFWVLWDNPRTCSTKSGVRWVTAVQAMHKINKLQDCGLDSTLLIETVQERHKKLNQGHRNPSSWRGWKVRIYCKASSLVRGFHCYVKESNILQYICWSGFLATEFIADCYNIQFLICILMKFTRNISL